MIPRYIDCFNENFQVCEYYMHKECPETCAYAQEIRGFGIGAIMEVGVIGELEKEVKDSQKSHNR